MVDGNFNDPLQSKEKRQQEKMAYAHYSFEGGTHTDTAFHAISISLLSPRLIPSHPPFNPTPPPFPSLSLLSPHSPTLPPPLPLSIGIKPGTPGQNDAHARAGGHPSSKKDKGSGSGGVTGTRISIKKHKLWNFILNIK